MHYTRRNVILILVLLAVTSPALGQSGWEDGGSVVHLTTSTDRVRIGTSTSAAKLTIANTTEHLRLVANSSIHDPWITSWDENQANRFWILKLGDRSNSNAFSIFSESEFSDVFTIKPDGNVGIGTSNPVKKFHIYGGDLMVTATDAYGADIISVGQDGKSIDLFSQNGHGNIKTDTDGMDIFFGAGFWGWDGAAYDRQLVLKSSGYIGIGTNTPGKDLHLRKDTNGLIGVDFENNSTGASAYQATRFISGTNIAGVYTYGQNHSSLANVAVFTAHGSNTELRLSQNNNAPLTIYTNNQERMRIAGDGNVGIGITSTPSGYKLAVDGKIIAEEVKVKDSGSWPDHVFQAGYDLMPLPEVERYIAEHQHLPGVPSAEEVAADGQSLGETQALLLQKIEELTLYVIDLKKENEGLKERMRALEIN